MHSLAYRSLSDLALQTALKLAGVDVTDLISCFLITPSASLYFSLPTVFITSNAKSLVRILKVSLNSACFIKINLVIFNKILLHLILPHPITRSPHPSPDHRSPHPS